MDESTKVAAPVSSRGNEVLTKEHKEVMSKSKAEYLKDGSPHLLRHGSGSRDKQRLIKNVQKLLMVEAHNFFQNPETSTKYGFSDTMSEKTKHAKLHEVYQRMCIDFADKSYVFGEADYTSFFETCLQPLVDAHDAKWFSVATLISSGVDSKRGFKEIKPKSVWDLGMKTTREFHALSKSFNKLLDSGKKVPTGEQWKKLMEKFRNALFLAWKEKDDGENGDREASDDDDEEEDDAPDAGLDMSALDLDEDENDENAAPFKYLPGKAHAWLLFCKYGQAGISMFQSVPLYSLTRNDAQQMDAAKKGRSEARKAKSAATHASSFDAAIEKFMDTVSANDAINSQKKEFHREFSRTLSILEAKGRALDSQLGDMHSGRTALTDGMKLDFLSADQKKEMFEEWQRMGGEIKKVQAQRDALLQELEAHRRTEDQVSQFGKVTLPSSRQTESPFSLVDEESSNADNGSYQDLRSEGSSKTTSASKSRTSSLTSSSIGVPTMLPPPPPSTKLNKDGTPRKQRSDKGHPKKRSGVDDDTSSKNRRRMLEDTGDYE
jgi:RNAse (barnase) inhibitor barstar